MSLLKTKDKYKNINFAGAAEDDMQRTSAIEIFAVLSNCSFQL